MFDPKHLFASVTNVTLELMAAGALFADLLVRGSQFLVGWGVSSSHMAAGISDAYYCAECTRLEKDRDGCPKIVNLGASRTDLFYERRRLGQRVSYCRFSGASDALFLLPFRIQEGLGVHFITCKDALGANTECLRSIARFYLRHCGSPRFDNLERQCKTLGSVPRFPIALPQDAQFKNGIPREAR